MMLVPFIILIVIGIILTVVKPSRRVDFGFPFLGIGIFGFCIISMVGIIEYFSSLGRIAEMEAFQNANRQNYSVVIEQTGSAVIELNSLLGFQISVENLKQSTNWSERIKEFRDEVVGYNRELARLRKFNENIWIAWMFANPSKDLKLIILER